jgi:E217 collar protein gp28
MIPGSNLLRMANRLIAFEPIWWSAFVGETKGAGMIITAEYATRVKITGSVQPITRMMYVDLGLDLQKDYFTVFTLTKLRDLRRNSNCDLLDFKGRRFNVESNTDWTNEDGWQASLCCDIGPTPP